jgi:hypothetical protein
MTTTYEVLAPLRAIADHLDRHDLPVPVHVDVRTYGRVITVQLHESGLSGLARALLTWAASLAENTVELWRCPSGHSVHLTVAGRLPSGLLVHVYGSAGYSSAMFPDMPEDTKQDVELSVLRRWAVAA